jgi:hypothetical protein
LVPPGLCDAENIDSLPTRAAQCAALTDAQFVGANRRRWLRMPTLCFFLKAAISKLPGRRSATCELPRTLCRLS